MHVSFKSFAGARSVAGVMGSLAAALVVSAAPVVSGCNTIKGLLGGDKETPETETEPTPSAEAAPTTSAAGVNATATSALASAAPSPSQAAVAIQAANESEIKRFDEEERLAEPVDTKIQGQAARVFKEPSEGELVAVLKPDTEVKKLAAHEGFALIAFENPDNAEETFIGWVKQEFVDEPTTEPAASAAPETPDCVPGLDAVFVGSNQSCQVICTSNAGCPTGKTCSGTGKRSTKGAPGAVVKFCAAPAAAPPPPPPKKTPAPPPKDEPSKKKKKKKKKKAD